MAAGCKEFPIRIKPVLNFDTIFAAYAAPHPGLTLEFRSHWIMHRRTLHLTVLLLGLTLFAGAASAGEKALMHCFYFTVVQDASEADWDAFKKATDELPGKIPGFNKVWHGKLRSPYNNYNSSGDKSVREHGVCMSFDDQAALGVYADHPAHSEWVKVYGKVRQPGTSTFDILGK